MTCIEIPTLRSARLVLRAFTADDLPHLHAMALDAEVTRYLGKDGADGPPPTLEAVWQRLAAALGQWALRGYGMFAVEDAEGFVGRAGLHHPFGEQAPQLSYILCRRSWGRGYATEAAASARGWMLEAYRPGRLVSHIAPENAASARVAARLGAVQDGSTGRPGSPLDVWRHRLTN